jgi:hypothetical protein
VGLLAGDGEKRLGKGDMQGPPYYIVSSRMLLECRQRLVYATGMQLESMAHAVGLQAEPDALCRSATALAGVQAEAAVLLPYSTRALAHSAGVRHTPVVLHWSMAELVGLRSV